jgi:hypothetical protein
MSRVLVLHVTYQFANIFSSLLFCRIYRSADSNTATSSTEESDPEKVLNAMTMKERRHYIDTILKVKVRKLC